MIYLELFWSFIQVGALSIGGGYAAMPLIQEQVTKVHHWISMQEFMDLITIAEMTPGPIALNSSTFVGYRIAGVGGALIATFGCILPSLVIVSLLAYLYFKFRSMKMMQGILGSLRPAVIALIAAAGINILGQVVFGGGEIRLDAFQWLGTLLFAGAVLLLRKFKWNPILVMCLCGVVSLAVGII